MYTVSPPKSKQTQFERRMTYDFLPLFGQSRLCWIFCMDWDFLQGVCWNIYSFPFLCVRDKGCLKKISHCNFDIYSVMSKQVGDFLGLFRKPELSYTGYNFSVIVLIHFLYFLGDHPFKTAAFYFVHWIRELLGYLRSVSSHF